MNSGDKGGRKCHDPRCQHRFSPDKESRFDAQRCKQLGKRAQSLSTPQKKDSAGAETVMKEWQKLFLQLRGQVGMALV
jgi:hypothetical protein